MKQTRLSLATIAAISSALIACRPPTQQPQVPETPPDSTVSADLKLARSNALAAPQSSEAWGRLGQHFDAANLHGQAEVCYSNASFLNPASPRWHHLYALKLLRAAPEPAAAHLQEAARIEGLSNDAPRLRLAQVFVERGRYADATNALAPLLSARPNHPAGRLEWARAVSALGNWDLAVDSLAPCLTNPYTARHAHALLSQTFLRLGNSNSAQRHAKIAAALPKPFDWPDPYLREVQNIRQDPRSQNEQANALIQQRRLEEADALIQSILTRSPDDAESLLLLGRVRLQQRRCPEAETLFRRHLAATPASLNGWVQLGMACYCQSKWLEASQAFEKAAQLKPDFGPAAFNRGLCQSRLGDSTSAILSFQHALRCNPGDAATHAALGEEFLRVGKLDEARSEAKQAAALDPNHPKVRLLTETLRRGR